MTSKFSFGARADQADGHLLKHYLLELIATKKTNLCVSADVHSTSTLLRIAEEVGDHICILKTHADIVDDFGERTIKGLREISRRKKFLIFEDRKLGDIGSTVQAQYTRGPLAIATWAHIVNAHIFPGPAIIPALKSAAISTIKALMHSVSTEIFVGTPHISSDGEEDSDYDFGKAEGKRPKSQSGRKGSVVTSTTIFQTVEMSHQTHRVDMTDDDGGYKGTEGALANMGDPPLTRGLLLFAQMSSEGNLMNDEYTRKCVAAARDHKDFVLGFISQQDLNEQEGDNFLSLTPGVKMPPPGEVRAPMVDGLGQQYRTPESVIKGDGCDVIIVGRGIIGAKDRAQEAERYKLAAWKAYESRLG